MPKRTERKSKVRLASHFIMEHTKKKSTSYNALTAIVRYCFRLNGNVTV